MKRLDLYARTVEAGEIAGMVPANFQGFCIVELYDENRLVGPEGLKDEISSATDRLLRCRVFGEKEFLHADRGEDGLFRIVANFQIPEATAKPLAFEQEVFREYYLWGTKYRGEPGRYFENIVPKIHGYPVGNGAGDRVKIKAAEYLDEIGDAVFFRFVDLV